MTLMKKVPGLISASSVYIYFTVYLHICCCCLAGPVPLTFPDSAPRDSASSRISRQTPSQDEKCVPIRHCKPIFESLNGPITADKVRRLQSITCGFEAGDPKVICLKRHIDISTRTGPTGMKLQKEDISVHPNFQNFPEFKDCGATAVKIRNYILGGVPAALGSYPWVARLGYPSKNTDYEFYCAGTLITSKYILTAAHCVTGGNPESSVPKIVRLGEHDSAIDPEFSPELNASSRVKDVGIAKIIIHQEYEPKTRLNDIALIRLSEGVSFDTPWIKPICLPFLQETFPSLAREFSESSKKHYAEIAGWGKTDDNNEGVNILQQTHIPLLSNSACNTIYHGKTTIAHSQMCAGGEAGVDSCSGDSGGPLMVYDDKTRRYFQGGIVSFGPSICGMKGFPGIYTRISSFFTWILDSMEK